MMIESTSRIIICSIVTIFIALIILLVVFIFKINNSTQILYKINWNIDIPNAKKVNIIDTFSFQDGEELSLLYYNKDDLNKIFESNAFKEIDKQSTIFIEKKINDFYETLDYNNKKLFDINVDIETLLIAENYFSYIEKEDKRSWLLLILDYKNTKIFSFENVY